MAEKCRALLPHYLSNAHASNTKSTYSSGWNSYLRFSEKLGQQPEPVTEDKLLLYLVAAHDSGTLTGKSLKGYVNAIVSHHKMSGLADPRQSALTKLLLNGCKRLDMQAGRIDNRADGLTQHQLNTLFRSLDPKRFEEARYGFFLSITVGGSTRAHEVILCPKTGVRLRWENLVVTRDHTGKPRRVDLGQPLGSKSRQFDRDTVVPLPITDAPSCVYTWMRHYRQHLPASLKTPGTPVFVRLDRPGLYLYRHALGDAKKYAARAGLGHLRLTTHSGRITVHNLAVRQRLSLDQQMSIGRWRGIKSLLRYNRPDLQLTSELVSSAVRGLPAYPAT